MPLYKNIGPVPVDLRGLLVPPGGTADVDPADEVVAERVAAGHILPVQTEPAEPPPAVKPSRPRTPKEH